MHQSIKVCFTIEFAELGSIRGMRTLIDVLFSRISCLQELQIFDFALRVCESRESGLKLFISNEEIECSKNLSKLFWSNLVVIVLIPRLEEALAIQPLSGDKGSESAYKSMSCSTLSSLIQSLCSIECLCPSNTNWCFNLFFELFCCESTLNFIIELSPLNMSLFRSFEVINK